MHKPAQFPRRILPLLALLVGTAAAMEPPSRPGVDAPELAQLGSFAVGVRTLELVNHRWPSINGALAAGGTVPRQDRHVTVDVWFPAAAGTHARPVSYTGALETETPGRLQSFTVPGIATRDAQPVGTGYPLVIVSHGRSNVTAALTWLTENLASKGYVVAAIRHEDPPYGDTSQFAALAVGRPLDVAFVARELPSALAPKLVDTARVALIGYSMGGCAVLTAAGATLDPDSPLARHVPDATLLRLHSRGGADRAMVAAPNVVAVVAIAPAGGGAAALWGDTGLADIHAPLLMIAGDHDNTVDYQSNARAFLDATTGTDRYLLTYRFGGHAIGLSPAPDAMRASLWDLDWFEDPVWRKDRIVGINLHFISAFLDRFVRQDAAKSAYLDVAVPESSAGVWPAGGAGRYADYSSGSDGVTVWKGFQRRHATGLELLARRAEQRAQ